MRLWPFNKREKREQSFTDIAMDIRAADITGRRGVAELTGAVQGCVSLWEQGLSIADTDNTFLTPEVLALTARSLGLHGESVWLIDDDALIPVAEFDISTKGSKPRAYRVTVPDVAGGYQVNALAAEVLHFKVGMDVQRPWHGTPPLRRAQLTAGMLHALEDALTETYTNAPLASQIVSMPETQPGENDKLESKLRGARGRLALVESANVTAAGGPTPQNDWKPQDLTPDVGSSMAIESWRDARNSILYAFGVLPAFFNGQATGPLVREAQRHLAQWTLQPIATMMAQEATRKLSATDIEVSGPLHAYDSGGRARAFAGVVQGFAAAKEAGITADQLQQALALSGVDISE